MGGDFFRGEQMSVCPHCGETFRSDDIQFTMHTMRCGAYRQIEDNRFASESTIAQQKMAYESQLANYQSQMNSLQNQLQKVSGSQVYPPFQSGKNTRVSGASGMFRAYESDWGTHLSKKDKAKKRLAGWAEKYFNGNQDDTDK